MRPMRRSQPSVSTPSTPPRYVAYLLRCWAEASAGSTALPVWRFSLEDPHTGQRRGFSSLDALIGWLRTEVLRQARADQLGGELPP